MIKELFFYSALLPFHLCIAMIFIFIIAETIGICIGYRPSYYIRRSIPEKIKKLPILKVKISKFIILIFFLINFSCAGYFLQLISYAIYTEFISFGWIFIPAFLLAIYFTVFMVHSIHQVIPPVYSQHQIHLIGRFATVIQYAKPGISAEACVRDQIGQLHHIQVQPEYGELEPQTQVILVGFNDNYYIAKRIIAQKNDYLSSNK